MNGIKIRQFEKKDFNALTRLIDNIFDKEDSLAAKQDIVFEVEINFPELTHGVLAYREYSSSDFVGTTPSLELTLGDLS